ncbi:PMS1-like protein [Trichoderma ghanense]|uniref:PMS1-like protein n=1 Tax=Trichoderma ghanense TaxID=65468 RepID=A0ABY2HAN8_9HYPO
MQISALPQSTVRLLGSSVIINTPCDVVKELLDNALDAGASFVEISISPNYLDTIRVRDDGRGIDVDDFGSLGRRAHTSKLRFFEELGAVVRETLGFRGEALAAVNTLGSVIVTTRTMNDVVASRLQLKATVGGVDNKQPVSAPVGTTVQVTKLFENMPPRKQYSLKNSAKYIQSTKDLLKGYAFARPDIRLSFKVLGEATSCWSYAPTCGKGVKEAALQMFGAALVNNCVNVSRNSGCDEAAFTQRNQRTSEEFILEALMPNTKFDIQAIKGKGLYLSVDSRPISSSRGLGKKLTSILKAALSRVAGPKESLASIPTPFMQLNIQCTPYSYDANVTPLKDDVLFANENNIIACFEGLCQEIYPQMSIEDPFSTQKAVGHRRATWASARGMFQLEKDRRQPCMATDQNSDTQAPDSPPSSHLLHTTEQSTAHHETANKGQTTDQGTASSPLLPESCAQDAKSVTGMRTSRTVNMARTNSNSTDEDGIANSLDIQVPLSLMTATPVPAQRADVSSRIPKKCASEDIERYLLSRKNGTFQIATDDTATRKTQHSSKSIESISGRMPLQPLTESMLNALNNQADSESETMSAGSEISDPNHGAPRFQQPSPGLIHRSFEPGPMEVISPPRARIPTDWPTPPSTGNLRSGRSLNSPLRPPMRTSQRDSPTGNHAPAHSRPRLTAPEDGRVIPFRLPGQNRIQRRVAHERPGQRVGSRADANSNIEETRSQPHALSVQGNRQRDVANRTMMQVSELASRPVTRQHVSQLRPFLQVPGPQSQIVQTSLMESLSSGVTSPMPDTAQYGLSAGHSVLQTSTPDIFRDTQQDTAPPGKVIDGTEDPRLYLIKRRRSGARHGIARRLSTRRLPLEAIPPQLTVQNASTSLRASLRKVKSLARRTRLAGYDAVPGHWGQGIEFKTMQEADKVEQGLQHAVEVWKQAQDQNVDVEYTLRSAAKGKGVCILQFDVAGTDCQG